MAQNGSICKLIMVALSTLSLSTSRSTEIFFHLRVMMRCYGPPPIGIRNLSNRANNQEYKYSSIQHSFLASRNYIDNVSLQFSVNNY